jgi:Arc/MetJ-type ribon-helix-helix transcriptional regulator
MKPLLVRLPEDLYDQLKQNRQLNKTSAAEYIRRAIRLALFADGITANPERCEPAQFAEVK